MIVQIQSGWFPIDFLVDYSIHTIVDFQAPGCSGLLGAGGGGEKTITRQIQDNLQDKYQTNRKTYNIRSAQQ